MEWENFHLALLNENASRYTAKSLLEQKEY